jgi:hypothetical protein
VFKQLRMASLALLVLLTAAGCEQQPLHRITAWTAASKDGACTGNSADSRFILIASIKELMDATVDPSADGLWDAVGTISTRDGTEERRPRTDEDWQQVRRYAITLLESTNLLLIEDRRAAPPNSSNGIGELSPEKIDRLISNNRASFVGFSIALSATAHRALDAIDRKDAEALLQAGGDIDQACEACHLTFWYPTAQARPSANPQQ